MTTTRTPTVRFASVNTLHAMAMAGAAVGGHLWYADAGATIRAWCRMAGVDPVDFAYVMAATSPRVHVTRNLRLTAEYFERGGPAYGTIDRMRSEVGILPVAVRPVAALEVARASNQATPWHELGDKTGPFGRALLGDGDALVIDVWMTRALVRGRRGEFNWPVGPPDAKSTDRAFTWLQSRANRAEATRRIGLVARRMGLTLAETQAAIWTTALHDYGRLTGIAFPSLIDTKPYSTE